MVHGEDGLDEITTTGTTFITEIKDGKLSDLVIKPEDFGIKRVDISALRGGEPKVNADALRALLDGQAGPYADIVALNAGAASAFSGKPQISPRALTLPVRA